MSSEVEPLLRSEPKPKPSPRATGDVVCHKGLFKESNVCAQNRTDIILTGKLVLTGEYVSSAEPLSVSETLMGRCKSRLVPSCSLIAHLPESTTERVDMANTRGSRKREGIPLY